MLSPRLELGPLVRTSSRQPAVFALVVLEIAAGVATIASLLMSARWYDRISERGSGLDEENLVLVSTYTPGTFGRERDDAAVERSVRARQAADRRVLRALPGVDAVVGVTTSILDERWSYPTMFVGRQGGVGRESRGAGWVVYTDPELLPVMRLGVLAGAAPGSGAGGPSSSAGVVLTRSLAEEIFGSAALAPGSTVVSEQNPARAVIGVVEDVRMRMPFMPNGGAVAFLFEEAPFDHEARLVVRATPGQRDAVRARAEAALGQEDAGRFVEVRAFDSAAGLHRRVGKGLLRLLGFFGALLGVVVLVGALASTSFLVAQRTRQIGIRRALGATRADVVSYFLVESALSTMLGSVLGVGGAFFLYLMMRRVFSEISFDVGLVALTLALLGLASVLATLIPALRAARIPPGVASRSL